MRLATWNVNSVVARLPRLLEWLVSSSPDVLCLQETKIADDAFPRAEVEALGYEVALNGEGRWNGVAIISRVGLGDIERGFADAPGFPETEARAMSATCGGLRVWSLYVPNGRALDSDHYPYKLQWLAALRVALLAEQPAVPPLFLCGDFNIAPTDNDVWDPAAFIGSTHVSAPEREALAALVSGLGLDDIQPRAFKGRPFTYWDYRAGNFHKGLGMRIDLVLLDHTVTPAVPMPTSIATRARARCRQTTPRSWSTSPGRGSGLSSVQLAGGGGALVPSATANPSWSKSSLDGVACVSLGSAPVSTILVRVPALPMTVEPLTVPWSKSTLVVSAMSTMPMPPTSGASWIHSALFSCKV